MPNNPASELTRLRELAADLGGNIRLVQGAGGNVSLKRNNDFWIKASGTWLSKALTENIFVHLNLRKTRGLLADGSEDFFSCVSTPGHLRPSIETPLHALMHHSVVVHLHSIGALYWAVQRHGQEAMSSRMKGLNWAWVDYARPGLPLTAAVQKSIAADETIDVVVLGNHGIICGADSTDEVRETIADVEERLSPPMTYGQSSAREMGTESILIDLPSGTRQPQNRVVHDLAFNPIALQLVDKVLYPDHAVFLGASIPVLSASNKRELQFAVSEPPYCVIVPGAGVVLGAKCSKATEAMLECFASLSGMLPSTEDLRYLSKDEISELITWDAEKLRQQAP